MAKLWHVVDGIFIWEFFVALNYEWSVIRGRRPYRWTIWLYSMTRLCTLITVILSMLALDTSSPINCQLWITFQLISGYLAIAGASLLIVLRIIAVWDGNRIATGIAVCAWCTNVAFLIHSVTEFHSIWVPVENVCGVLDTQLSKKTIIATLVTDLVLLFTMLFGLLRLRRHGTMFGLGQLLWNQGLVWLFAATVAEVPPAVFLIVNLNDPFNLMFLLPAIIVMSIAATRMHRSLSDYAHSSGSSFDTYPTRRGHTSNSDPRTLTTPIPLDRVEVAVHTSSQDYPLTKVDSYGPYDSKSQLQDKAPGLGNGSDLEHEAERG